MPRAFNGLKGLRSCWGSSYGDPALQNGECLGVERLSEIKGIALRVV
jgi:hypothetical protein